MKVSFLLLSVLAAACTSASAEIEPRRQVVGQTPRLEQSETLEEAPLSARAQRLADWLENVIGHWPKIHPKLESIDRGALARDIAFVVAEELPLWQWTGDKALEDPRRHKTAIMMATLAYWEGSRFAKYVDDQSCNDKDWRKTEEGARMQHAGGDCDGGHAFSLFQIHTEHALTLTDGEVVTPDKLKDRRYAIAVALWIARSSLRRHATDEDPCGTLADYTGEWDKPEHPAADQRLNWAKRQWKKHP
jgi:hypothetical protein